MNILFKFAALSCVMGSALYAADNTPNGAPFKIWHAKVVDMATIRDFMHIKLTQMAEAGRLSGTVEEEIDQRMGRLGGLNSATVAAFLVEKREVAEVVGFGSYAVADGVAKVTNWLCMSTQPQNAPRLFDVMETAAAKRGLHSISVAMLSDHPGIGFLAKRGYALVGPDATDPERTIYTKCLM